MSSTAQIDQPTDARQRLFSHFASAKSPTEHGKQWDALWKEDWLPWDKGFPNPALVDLLSARYQDLPPKFDGKRRKALVPGCGKGYDVLLLAAYGYDAYGLEVSSTALDACRKVEKEFAGKDVYEKKVDGGSVTWLLGDFWKNESLKEVEGEANFDLIYDYTFLSALPPSMRPAWSQRFVKLLKPEGRIVCVEFPTYKPPSTGGPPWALPPKVYVAHLTRPGEEIHYNEDGELDEARLGKISNDALVQLEHFQPERSHQIGYSADGKVTDWIGIWAHSARH